jgi:hypothetical protein
MYLNLGWVGVALLLLLIAWGYHTVVAALPRDRDVARLKLAYFVIAILYNFTEAAFKVMHPVWLVFLLATVAVPPAVPTPPRRRPTA